jgi:hypothetical protein
MDTDDLSHETYAAIISTFSFSVTMRKNVMSRLI